MAWTEQAWRHSLAGLPDPSQADTEQQFRLSLAGVPNASDLYDFTPEAWDYDESLTLTITPLPDTGFDVTTRYALTNVPAVNLTDSIDRDGAATPALGGLTLDFDGTYVGPGYDGALEATLGGLSAAFVGDFVYRHYFDVGFAIVPTWIVTEQGASFGDLSLTLGGLTTSFTGYALPPNSTQGSMDATLGGLSFDLDGTVAAPPTFTGDMGLDLASISMGFSGTFVPAGSTGGAMGLTLDPISTDFDGTFAVWNSDGTFNTTLGSLNISVRGQFIDSNASKGDITAVLGGLTFAMSGSVALPEDIETIQMRVDTDDDAIMKVDTAATAKMRT